MYSRFSRHITRKGELRACGLIPPHNSHGPGISRTVAQIYGQPEQDISELFCSKLSGDTLPLDNFSIAPEDLSHITRLLTAKTTSPLHIMLYGPPGTEKTTLARSLAQKLGLTALMVNTTDEDMYSGQTSSLITCMNIAAKHPNSFVVVDEAEKVLHTSLEDSNDSRGKEKSWLNALLEKPCNKVIWHWRKTTRLLRR